MSPASRAMVKAGPNGSGAPAASSLAKPKATTPFPAKRAATVACSTARAGDWVRSADTSHPTPTPVSADARRPASTSVSADEVIAPERPMAPQVHGGLDPAAPSAAASSTTSRTSRVRIVDRPDDATSGDVELLEVGEGAVGGGHGGDGDALGSSHSSCKVLRRMAPSRCRWRCALGRATRAGRGRVHRMFSWARRKGQDPLAASRGQQTLPLRSARDAGNCSANRRGPAATRNLGVPPASGHQPSSVPGRQVSSPQADADSPSARLHRHTPPSSHRRWLMQYLPDAAHPNDGDTVHAVTNAVTHVAVALDELKDQLEIANRRVGEVAAAQITEAELGRLFVRAAAVRRHGHRRSRGRSPEVVAAARREAERILADARTEADAMIEEASAPAFPWAAAEQVQATIEGFTHINRELIKELAYLRDTLQPQLVFLEPRHCQHQARRRWCRRPRPPRPATGDALPGYHPIRRRPSLMSGRNLPPNPSASLEGQDPTNRQESGYR